MYQYKNWLSQIGKKPPDFGGYTGGLSLYGEDATWIAVPEFGIHRDSDVLARANYAAFEKLLTEKFGEEDVENGWVIERSNHWAVGWVEGFRIHAIHNPALPPEVVNLTEVADFVIDILNKMDNYPVLDEDLYSQMEYDESLEMLQQQLRYDFQEATTISPEDLYELLSNAGFEPREWVAPDQIWQVLIEADKLLEDFDPEDLTTRERKEYDSAVETVARNRRIREARKAGQPCWVRSETYGDPDILGEGGRWLYTDLTKVYPTEVEVLNRQHDGRYERSRYILDKCTYRAGVLSDNKYHPGTPARFADKIEAIADHSGYETDDLIKLLCSFESVRRMWGYKGLEDYFGVFEFDQYPILMTRKEVIERYDLEDDDDSEEETD